MMVMVSDGMVVMSDGNDVRVMVMSDGSDGDGSDGDGNDE